MLFQLSSTPLEESDLREKFNSPQAGAFNSFEGHVRDHNNGKSVIAIEYEAYAPLCQTEAMEILNEAKKKFKIIDIKVAHRVGHLKVEDLAVWVGVLAAHRDDSFMACHYVIDELKKRLPIWKKEYYAGGDSNWNYHSPNTQKPVACKKKSLTISMSSIPDEQLKEFIFVDIRESQELALEPVFGIESVHLPLSQFKQRNFSFEQNKDYILFCSSGTRSMSLVEYLHEQGTTNVYSLNDGMNALEKRFQK